MLRRFFLFAVITMGCWLVPCATSVAADEPAAASPAGSTDKPNVRPAEGSQPADDSASPQDATSGGGHAAAAELVAEYRRRYEAFQVYRRELGELLTQRPAEADKVAAWQQAVDAKTQAGIPIIEAVVAAAERAIVVDPTNDEMHNFLELLAAKAHTGDLLEDAARTASLLADLGLADEQVYHVAYASWLEMGELDKAEKYMRMAEKDGQLVEGGQKLLAAMPSYRAHLEKEFAIRAQEASADDLPRVVFRTNRGEVVVELFENQFPNAVASLISLVESGFYDNLVFYRVSPGFGASTGCPLGNGSGNPDYWLLPEADEANYRPHLRGTVSMVRLSKGLHASQLFFAYRMLSTSKLNSSSQVVGRVIEGMEILSRLKRHDPLMPGGETGELDRIIEAKVLRKRPHVYKPVTTLELANARRIKANEAKTDEERNEHLLAALAIDPDQFDAHIILGEYYLKMKDLKAAHGHFSEAVRIKPNDMTAQLALGNSFVSQRRYPEAINTFRYVIKAHPRELRAYNNLASALFDGGKLDEAKQVLKEALRIDPNYAPAIENLRRLNAVR